MKKAQEWRQRLVAWSLVGVVGWSVPAAAGGDGGLVWQQTGTIEGTEVRGRFGISVGLSGDTLMVGASDEDLTSQDEGVVYVYERQGGIWTVTQLLIASDRFFNDRFGYNIALDGDEALISSPGAREPGSAPGAIYVFERIGGVWVETDKILSPDPDGRGFFGVDLAKDGDTFVSCTDSSSGGLGSHRRAWVYVRSGSGWTLQQQIVPDVALPMGVEVSYLAVDESTVLIGDSDAGLVGEAYAMVRSGTTWSFEQSLLLTTPSNNDHFGVGVALEGDTALITAGRVRRLVVMSRTGNVWSVAQNLIPPPADDCFGCDAVVFDGSRAVVSGARRFGAPDMTPGSVWTLEDDGSGDLVFEQRLTGIGPETSQGDQFGKAVALQSDELVVGAPNRRISGSQRGAVFIFERAPGPVRIFADGFESGDTAAWATTP